MIGDKGFTDDSVRSLIYLLCNQKAFKKITDFENDEIFEDGPLIGFSSKMNNDITEDLEKDTYYVYLNTNAIYEVAKLSVKAFEIYSFEDIFKKIRLRDDRFPCREEPIPHPRPRQRARARG